MKINFQGVRRSLASISPFSFLVLAVLFSSCEKDNDTLPSGKILITTEKHLSPEKTSVSGTTVQWVSGDMVRLYIGEYENNLSVAISDDHNAYVNGWKGKTGVIRAYYPNTIIGDALGATDAPTVTIPSCYDSEYSDDRQVLALPMVGTAKSGDTTVEFKHLTAALMVKLRNDTLSALTLDSVVVSSNQYLLSDTMKLNLGVAGFGVVARATTQANSVTVRFSGITIGTGSIKTVQIPIRPIGESNLRIEVYAHCQGDAIGIDGMPSVPTTVVYHYDKTNPSPALNRNVMLAAGIGLSAGNNTRVDTIDNSLFSVSSNKKVRFSKGNLWYTTSSGYTFHTNQYDCNGTTQLASNKDLFPWKDTTYISDWSVLSAEEWNYLINTRPGDRFAKACVNGVNGLIIFSDTYRHPIALALVKVNYSGSMNYSENTFDTGKWESMEAAGAIFLPAAGYLNLTGTIVESYGAEGDYWSSTSDGDYTAKHLEFRNDEVTIPNGVQRTYGYSVRLIKVATNP